MGSEGVQQDAAATALEEGRLWRAKEILSGRIGACEYDPILFEQYGLVLLRMGDLIEAGRFLLLSGVRRPEYDEAIALFLRKNAHAGYRSLLGTFPRSVRRLTWQQLPPQLQADLRAAGVSESAANTRLWARLPSPEPGADGCLGLVLTLIVLGLIASWVVVHFGYR